MEIAPAVLEQLRPDFKFAFTGKQLLDKAGLGLDHSGNCSSYLYRKDKKRSRFLFRTTCAEPYSKGPWTSRVFFIGGRSGTREFKEIKVWCNCTFFQYYGVMYNAVANNFDDSGRKRVKAPDIRDPARKNWLCKHLVSSIPIAMGDRDAYYKSVREKKDILRKAREEKKK